MSEANIQFIKDVFDEGRQILTTVLDDPEFVSSIHEASSAMASTFESGGQVFSCGNGGSFCDAMHFAEELTGRYRIDRTPLPAQAINDGAYMTCVANDYHYDEIFSRYVRAWGRPGDMLLAISTSGNSPNVIKAVEVAKQKQMKTIALLGKGGGDLMGMVDHPILVPSKKTERVQEMHIKVIHLLIELVEKRMFPENYK